MANTNTSTPLPGTFANLCPAALDPDPGTVTACPATGRANDAPTISGLIRGLLDDEPTSADFPPRGV